MATIAEAFALAWQNHQAGHLAQAEQIYRQILQVDPAHADSWYYLGAACQAQGRFGEAEASLRRAAQVRPTQAGIYNLLGVVLAQQGKFVEAAETLQQSLRVDPRDGETYSNLGAVLAQLGQPEEALEVYRQSLRLKPGAAATYYNLGLALRMLAKNNEAIEQFQHALRFRPEYPEALNDLGNALVEQGKLAEAIGCYRQALRMRPEFAEVHFNLGCVAAKQGNHGDAISHFRQALRFKPDYGDAYFNLGNALRQTGQLVEAAVSYRQGARFQPPSAELHMNLGWTLAEQGKPAEAVAAYEEGLRIQPQRAETHLLLGIALGRLGRYTEAMTCFQEAIRLEPTYANVHNSLGNVLLEQGLHEEAQASFAKALQLKPELAETHNNLANALSDQGKLDEALACYREALRHKPRYVEAYSNLLMHLNYHSDSDPDSVFAEHQRWDAVFGQAATPPPHANTPDPNRILRVGYVTPDLQRHPVHKFFVEPILAHHDVRQVEVFCYAQVPRSLSPRMLSLACCRPISGLPDAAVAQQVRADAIDILVDLAGHTVNSRLGVFTYKPAPVQVTGLGYPNTTGLAAMDYRLTDAIADPPGEPRRHTEELIRFAGAFCCYSPAAEAPPVTPLPALRNGHITFGSPHHLAKINGKVLDAWCAILRALPTARLLVFRHSLKGKLKDDLHQRFLQRGIGPEQIELQTATDFSHGFLDWYGSVDIVLDAFPWSSHTTACDSLWMGVPLLTLRGHTHVARMAASVLSHVGLDEWVANTPAEYEEKAVTLAGDMNYVARMRSELRERLAASRLCDGRSYTQGLEAIYRQIWQRWCARPRA